MARLIGFLACTTQHDATTQREKNENISKTYPTPNRKRAAQEGLHKAEVGEVGDGEDWLEKFCRHLANESIEIERQQWR